jgi:tetratricopeptide (TPR) repeat protein
MLTGEPGIGKTRTTREFADFARQAGAAVLWGACYEGEWAPPFGPFAEAIAAYSGTTDAERLRADLGPGCAAIARLVPVLRDALPGIPEPASLQPEEERFRLLDAVSQFLIALAARAPVVLVLEDLHWADKGTIAMLRHVARFAARHPILVVGNYRDVELGRHHPLSDALGGLARETSYDRIALRGLAVEDVDRLLETIANETVPEPFVAALSRETNGNPFFIREVLLHLAEEGTIVREDGHWTARVAIEAMGIPESVRQVIGRRLARLSPNANRLLTAATAFSNVFPFAVLAAVVGGDEAGALDAIDEALEAQLVRPAGPTDTYEFTHALIRHTLYSELSPSRQVRLHRQVAEAMERLYGAGAAAHAAELAYQYARSAVLPGADRGADYALLAAERAQRACAHDELAAHLRIALDLLPETDPRRPRLSARLAMALAWTLSVDEALPLFHTAGDQIAAGEGRAAAANYLADAALALSQAGFARAASSVAKHGQTYAGERRDRTWVRLKVYEIVRREMHEPDYSGIVIDTEERREVAAVAAQCRDEFTTWEQGFLWITGFLGARSRGEALELFRTNPNDPTEATNLAGEFQPCVPLWEEWAARSEREGRIADAALYNAYLSRCLNALGEFAGARGAYERGRALAARLTVPAVPMINLAAAQEEMWRAQAERSERAIQQVQSLLEQPAIENAWALVLIRAVAAVRYGGRQRAEDALSLLAMQLPSIERAPGWAPNYTMVVCDAVSVLWQLQRTEHADVLEANVRDKVLAPDFRYPMRDGRLALAQLCALTGRDDEAVDWFARARQVLEEQGAKPLRAMVDFDEALMYQRRAGRGDTARAVECWQRAVPQFEALGMTGWVRRVEALRAV